MIYQYNEPLYLISIVSKMLDIHPQTLRQYERENLVCPSRSSGGIRLYSQRDIDRIKLILRLTRELGVNLAGIDIILRLKKEMEEMESDIEHLKAELCAAENKHSVSLSKALVPKRSIYEIILFTKTQ